MNQNENIDGIDIVSDTEMTSMSVDECESALVALMSEIEELKGDGVRISFGENNTIYIETPPEKELETESDGKKAMSDEEFAFAIENIVEVDEKASDSDEYVGSAVEYISDNDLFSAAARLVVEERVVSTSFLQRRLGIGFGRAAAIVSRLEELGVVGHMEGNMPRRVLVSTEKLEKILAEL